MSINSIFAGSTPNSRDTIRQQYLNTLTLDIANQTKNLNANKLFKANGSTGSEPADTRSATEKYEDLDNLKVQVRAGLKQITDGMEAERIVADITTAELQFLAGHLPFIVSDLKPKWALGVPAGSFLPYFRKLMRKNIETEGVEYGLQSASTVGGGVESTANNLISRGEIEELGQELGRPSGRDVRERRNASAEQKIHEKLRLLDSLVPTMEDRDIIASLHDPDILNEYDEDVAQVGQNIPSAYLIREAFRQVPIQAMVARFDALFDAVDWEMMRSLKGAVSSVRHELSLVAPGPPSYEEEEEEMGQPVSTPLGIFPDAPPPEKELHQAENDGTMLPSSYVNAPVVAEKFNQLSAFSEEIPPEDFKAQGYNTKIELLRTYADEGKFNSMDATFLHMINAIMEGHEVPERDMDIGYTKFFRLKQLGGLTEKGEMPQTELRPLAPSLKFQTEAYPPAEQVPPTRPPFYEMGEEENPDMLEEEATPIRPPKFKSLSTNEKWRTISDMLDAGDFRDMPDFEEVANEIVYTTEEIPDYMFDNFFDAFLHHKGEGGRPLQEPEPSRIPSRAPPTRPVPAPPLEEEEEITITPKKKQEEREYNPVDIGAFRQLSSERQKAILQTLLDAPPEVQSRIDGLANAPQKKTMEYIYGQYLFYRQGQLTKGALEKAGPESSGKKEGSVAGTTEAEQYTNPNTSLSKETEVLGSPKAVSLKVHYPKVISEFEKLNQAQQKAILDKAYGDGVIDSDELNGDKAIEYGDLIRTDAKITKAKAKDIYNDLLPVIQSLQSQGIIGIGLKKKPSVVNNDVIHIDFEKGSLPKGRPKKSKNIIFGKGLSSVIPQPKVRVESKNIDFSKGISAEPAYVPFGTHLLNKHRLKDNIVMMRTKKGGAIVNIPTQKVSGKLAKVLHIISGGGIPQFESVMDLTEGDKALLHQISKTSKVSDRLSVPNPNKSKMEEEDNRFNILRGEVAIGNDNPTVIKEFKVLLLKFMREGRVPTGQGKAIMEELLLMGY